MTNELVIPAWAKKVTNVQPRRRAPRAKPATSVVRMEHEIEVEPYTATYTEVRDQVWRATPRVGQVLKALGLSKAQYRKSLTDAFDKLDDLGPQLWKQLCAEAEREFERTDRVTQFPIGPVTYQLRDPLKAQIAPSDNQGWEFSVDQFRPRFVGKGASIASAQRDFLNQVHAAFQLLVRRRPFQMDEAQRTDWQILERLIDVDAYWDCIPVTLLEIGVMSAITDAGWEVIWLDGERKEIIPIERTLPEFAALQPEHWFEALVERQPRTYELKKLRYVRPIEPIQAMSPDEFRKWIDSLSNGEDVPKSGTTWTDL